MESKIKLLDQMRLVLRLKHMSIRTEDTYVHWVRRFILFHHKRHPQDMGATEIRASRCPCTGSGFHTKRGVERPRLPLSSRTEAGFPRPRRDRASKTSRENTSRVYARGSLP